MNPYVLEELYVRGYPISICQSPEGDIYPQFEFPIPPSTTQEAIIAYLHNEGLLEKKPKTQQIPQIVVTHNNGITETFPLTRSKILAFDSSLGEATICTEGHIRSLTNVQSITTK